MAKKVRILLDTRIDGVDYKINQVVALPDTVAKAYIEAGMVDASKEAVSYAVSEGAEVVTHTESIDAPAVTVDAEIAQ